MKTLALELETFIDQHVDALRSVNPDTMSDKPSPSKWSKKEIIRHLIDSAESNIRRFVIAQYEETPHITYNQDKWVMISGYQQWDTNTLIELWWLLNKQACAILRNMEPGMSQRMVQTEALHTIEWLAVDYIKHLRHHIHQVLDLELVSYS